MKKNTETVNSILISILLLKEGDSWKGRETVILIRQFMATAVSPRHLRIRNIDVQFKEHGEWRQAEKKTVKRLLQH